MHNGAHLWKFGDSGSVIMIVNDDEPTDHILFTTDQGLSWLEFKFTTNKIRVRDIMAIPEGISQKFMILGQYPGMAGSVIVHLDFSSLTHRKCESGVLLCSIIYVELILPGLVDARIPGHDDFELWGPSEERDSLCLFRQQVSCPNLSFSFVTHIIYRHSIIAADGM